MKKITFDKIYFIILCAITVSLNFVVGFAHKEPKTIMEIIMILSAIVYIFVKKIQSNETVVIKNKIDIIALGFGIIIFIPLILKNYYSLNDTVNNCMMYLSVFSIYILSRNILNTQKKINIFMDVVIASSVLTVIFGLDGIFYYSLEKLHVFFGNPKTGSSRMVANFGYPNTLAAYLVFTIMLALGRYFVVENKKVKYLYISYIQIGMIGFVYGNSRALMLMFAAIFLIYLIFLKDKEKILQAIWIIGSNLVIAFIFEAILNKFATANWNLWLMFVLDIILVYLLNYILADKIFKIKINKKIFIIIISISIIFGIIYFAVTVRIGKPQVIREKQDAVYLQGLKNNKEYNIKIDLNVEEQENLTIKLMEKNVDQATINEYKKDVIKGNQTKEFNVNSSDSFSEFVLKVVSTDNENYNYKVTVNKIYVNGKEYIFNYKYIPNEIMRMVKTLNFRTRSITDRLAYCKYSVELSRNHIIFGAGGRAYYNHVLPLYEKKHSCYHDPHCFIMTLLTNYGIIGVSAYCTMLGITLRNLLKRLKKLSKEKNKNYFLYLSILFALVIYTIHSFVDFDFSYLLTATLVYIFIGMLNDSDTKIEKDIISVIDYVVMIGLAITVIVLGCRAYGEKLLKDEKYEEAIKYCSYSSTFKKELMDKAKRTNKPELIEKYLFKYIEDEKYKDWNSVYSYFDSIYYEALQNKDYEKTAKILNSYYKYFTENNNTNEHYTGEIKSRNTHINLLVERVEKDTEANKIKEISELCEKFKAEKK